MSLFVRMVYHPNNIWSVVVLWSEIMMNEAQGADKLCMTTDGMQSIIIHLQWSWTRTQPLPMTLRPDLTRPNWCCKFWRTNQTRTCTHAFTEMDYCSFALLRSLTWWIKWYLTRQNPKSSSKNRQKVKTPKTEIQGKQSNGQIKNQSPINENASHTR